MDAAKLEIVGDLTAILTKFRPNQIQQLSNVQRFRKLEAETLGEVMRTTGAF